MKEVRGIDEVPLRAEDMALEGIQSKIGEVVVCLEPDQGISEIDYARSDTECEIYADDSPDRGSTLRSLTNAIRYARTKIQVMDDYDAASSGAILAVRDDGPDLPKNRCEALRHLIKKYEDDARDEHFGIGLHICRQLCRISTAERWTLPTAWKAVPSPRITSPAKGIKRILIFRRENIRYLDSML